METFLLTYKAFTTSEYVIEGLKKFYWQVMSGKPTDMQASKRNLGKIYFSIINPLSANPTKWLNTLKQFVGCCRQIV